MSDDIHDDASSMTEYDSGPFCRHWGDPADCEEVCDACGHQCCNHPDGCNLCDCQEWKGTP